MQSMWLSAALTPLMFQRLVIENVLFLVFRINYDLWIKIIYAPIIRGGGVKLVLLPDNSKFSPWDKPTREFGFAVGHNLCIEYTMIMCLFSKGSWSKGISCSFPPSKENNPLTATQLQSPASGCHDFLRIFQTPKRSWVL